MNFCKFLLSSLSLCAAMFQLVACNTKEYKLSFDTQNIGAETYCLTSSLKAILPDSVGVPESMNTNLFVKATNSLLTSYDDNSGRFQMKIDSVDYKSDKRTVEEFSSMERYMTMEHFQYKMASDGVISDAVIEDSIMLGTESLDLIRLFLKVQPLLPSKAVSVGETWERPIDIPAKGGHTTIYKSFTLEDYYVHDGIQMAKILMNVRYKEIPDSTADLKMESNGFIVGTGSIIFNMTKGVISKVKLELNGDIGINDVVAAKIIPEMRIIQKIEMWQVEE